MGYPYEGFLIPFGALVWYKDLDKQGFEPNGSPAIYLGPEVVAGMRYKATHRVFPLKRVKEGVFQAVWTRNLALPNGDWTFPLAVKDAGDGPKAIDFQGDGPKAIEFRPDPLGSFEERVAAQDSDYEPEVPLPDPPSDPKDQPSKGPGGLKPRNRTITAKRIEIHGRTPGCDGCIAGVFVRSKECRERFNVLLADEPVRTPYGLKEPESGPKDPPGKVDEGQDNPGVSVVLDIKDPFGDPDVSDPNLLLLEDEDAFAPAEEERADQDFRGEPSRLERGTDVVGGVFMDAIEAQYGMEDELSVAYASVCANADSIRQDSDKTKPETKGKRAKPRCFVEFCCREGSELSGVAKQFGIEYSGLSKEFVDLTDPEQFRQVLEWARFEASQDKAIDLWGSLPCTHWSPWMNMSLHRLGPKFRKTLEAKRNELRRLISHFTGLAEVAFLSGGSISFEWPRYCAGWLEPRITHMISWFRMFSAFPTGCGFGLVINGKHPLKPWRIVSTHQQLAQDLDRRRCIHGKGHKHDPLEGGLTVKSGFYNRNMVTCTPKLSLIVFLACPLPNRTCAKGGQRYGQRDGCCPQAVVTKGGRGL